MGNLKEIDNDIPKEILKEINKSYEVIGNLAIVQIKEKHEIYESKISKFILKNNKNIKTILKKTNVVDGLFRIPKHEFLEGEKTFETIHKENGTLICVNPNDVYFSAKQSNQRLEIFDDNLNKKNILICFSGVGPYAFNCLKKNPNIKRIDNFEINPKGEFYAKKNLELNKNLIKKNYLFKEIISFLKENKIYIKEREISKNLIELKVLFFTDDVKNISKKINLENYIIDEENIGEFEFMNDEILKRNFLEIFNFLSIKENKNIIIDLDNLDNFYFDYLKFILIYFKNKKFFFKFEKKFYYLKDNFSKSIFLNYFENNFFEEKIYYDEIFMPAPKDAPKFLEKIFSSIKKNSKIYIYDFCDLEEFENIEKKYFLVFEKNNLNYKFIKKKMAGQTSPKKYRIYLTFEIKK